MKISLTLLILFLGSFFSNSLQSQNNWNYISPVPGSKFINPESTIVFRQGEKINKSSIDNPLIKVSGSASGLIEGKLILSKDERTLIFYPNTAFQYKESVTVVLPEGIETVSGIEMNSVRFSFTTTNENNLPLLRQYYEQEYENEIATRQISGQNSYPDLSRKKEKLSGAIELPADFPTPLIVEYDNPAPGYNFVSPRSWGLQQRFYSIIMDSYGTPIFYRKWPIANNDFKVISNNRLAVCEFDRKNPLVNKYLVSDSKYDIIDTLTMGNGYLVDQHDLLMDEDGNHFLMAYDPQLVGMDTVVEGGNPNATVIGFIVQELDADHNVIFQWRSWDHFEITDGNFIDYTGAKIDYVHGNAFEVDHDGNLLLCCRGMDEITKIDRNTGNIIWRFGLHAQKNMFNFTNDTIGFYHQHNIRRLENGNISLYDNGNYHSPKFSQSLEYAIDEEELTATLVWNYVNNPPVYGRATGSSQRLDNNNTLIGWGLTWPVSVTEVDETGSKEWELHFPDSVSTYRAFRFDWKTDLFTTNWDTIDFGEYDDYVPWVNIIRLTNTSDREITITGTSNHFDSYTVPTTMPFTIPVGEYSDIIVSFYPNQLGQINDILTIYSESLFADSLPQLIARQVYLKGSIADNSAPFASFEPEDGSTDISPDTVITITFNESIVKADGSTIKNSDLIDLIVLKENDESGEGVSFSATIDLWKKIITVKPDTLIALQTYYVGIPGESVADKSGNILSETQAATFTVEEGSGVYEEFISSINVFPNPTSGIVQIEFTAQQADKITVFKLSGEQVSSIHPGNGKKISIDLSNESSGIYLLEMGFEGISKTVTLKVIKR